MENKDDRKPKAGNSSPLYGSNECLLYSMHFLMLEVTSEFKKYSILLWT